MVIWYVYMAFVFQIKHHLLGTVLLSGFQSFHMSRASQVVLIVNSAA